MIRASRVTQCWESSIKNSWLNSLSFLNDQFPLLPMCLCFLFVADSIFVFVFFYRLNIFLTGMNPLYFHAVNVILHCLVTLVLMYTCDQAVFRNRRLAFATALLFAVHPIHTEAVSIPGTQWNNKLRKQKTQKTKKPETEPFKTMWIQGTSRVFVFMYKSFWLTSLLSECSNGL